VWQKPKVGNTLAKQSKTRGCLWLHVYERRSFARPYPAMWPKIRNSTAGHLNSVAGLLSFNSIYLALGCHAGWGKRLYMGEGIHQGSGVVWALMMTLRWCSVSINRRVDWSGFYPVECALII